MRWARATWRPRSGSGWPRSCRRPKRAPHSPKRARSPKAATVNVQIDASSLVTGDEKRDGHLRSPDFLDAEQFPYITFKSTGVQQVDESHGKLSGDLTIRDITKPVVLDFEYAGQAKTPWGT